MQRGAPMSFTPTALGESLTQVVWASFSDYLESGEFPTPDTTGQPDLVVEELLIFFLWVHTRACQQVLGSTAGEAALKETLDAMHRTLFEDLEAHGTPRDRLPLIEQRVSARYSEYYSAVESDEDTVGEVAARWVSGQSEPDPQFSAALAHAAIIAVDPLRDFLAEAEIRG